MNLRFFLITLLASMTLLTTEALAISGSIADENGNGLAGAKVTLISNGSVLVSYSGTNGSYSFSALTPDTNFTIRVTLSGYAAQSQSGNSNSDEEVHFEFEAVDATISGRVMQPDGTAIAFAVINAGSLGNYVSDANGDFLISAPVGTSYTLEVSAADMFFTAPTAGTLKGNTRRIIVGDLD